MLTPSQHRALRTDHHLSVTANAGSGKTLVLVERYVAFVAGGIATPVEIVAITFTEKAAAELKRKISDAIAVRLTAEPPGPPRRALESAREQIPSAVIGTIHAFCKRLLQEFPVEAGVDASFTVIEPVDQEVVMREAIMESFRTILRDGAGGDEREKLLAALRLTGRSRAIAIVTAFARRRETVERLGTGTYANPDAEILATTGNTLGDALKAGTTRDDFKTTLEGVVGGLAGKGVEQVRGLQKKALAEPDVRKQAALLHELFERLFTKEGGLRKSMLGRGQEEPPETSRLKIHAAQLRPLVDALREGNEGNGTDLLLPAVRALLAVHEKALHLYDERKAEHGQLDFEDLLIRTRALLGKPLVRERLAKRYRSIMVDEYQDTNHLQYEILQPLLDDFRTGNLFIVGDPKQSIYGFRDADVRIFDRTRRDIVAASDAESNVVLGESFRPLRAITAFVNLVFNPLMQGNGEDVAYDPLIQARLNPDPGTVTLLVRREGEEGSSPEEGDVIARHIMMLRRKEVTVYEREEAARPVRYSDIAILLRSRTILGEIERGLVRHGIPHVVSGGIGYFQTQTVFDFYNYFRFLLNRDDDVALAGILRAPFFSVSDAELYAVAGIPRDGSLWSEISRREVGLPGSLRRAVRMLREDLATGLRMSIPELLERVVERTGYEGILAGIPSGDQGAANLRKLRILASTYERRGLANVHDFVRRLDRLVEEEEREGQGAIDLTQDAVRVMTIHAAKGLEFPLVVVAGVERPFRPPSEPFIDAGLGIGFGLNKNGEKVFPPLVEVLKETQHLRDIAEEKRIFYVACTRARDHLVLSALITDKPRAESRLAWVLDGAGISPGAPDGVVRRMVPLTVLTTDGVRSRPENEQFPLQVTVSSGEEGSTGAPAAVPGPPEEKLPPIRIDPIPESPGGEMFSASSLRTYEECPSLYYLRYVLGVPARGAPKGETPEEEESDPHLRGETRGIVTHAALERSTENTNLPELIAELLRSQGVDAREFPEEVQALKESVEQVRGSEFWKRVEAGSETRTEFAITAMVAGEFVTGTIDRLFKERDGGWHVVDFKTDAVERDEIGRRAKFYRSQIHLYALLASRLFDAKRIRATLLFTRHVDIPQTEEIGEAELRAIESHFSKVIDRIKSLDFKPLQSPCQNCPFSPEGCKTPGEMGV